MRLSKFILMLLVCLSSKMAAQTDFQRQFNNGKDLFRQEKYNLAMETFKPLIAYDAKNAYSEYASFYYALAAYKQGYKAVAKDMFNQIKTLHPQWDKLPEVNFWLGKIHLDNNEYFQALKIFQALDDKKFSKDIEFAKSQRIPTITDTETLTRLLEEYPKDKMIAETLASVLAKNVSDPEEQKRLLDLIDKYNLRKGDYIAEAPKTFYKDKYAVAVMFPFAVSSLDPTPVKKRNQILLDFYEGMKLAADTLNKQGVNISLRAYDTERSTGKIKRLLGTEELKNTDLIVGPFYLEENKLVQDFALENKINVIHPFSNSSEIIGNNPYGFLFQPSSETLGKESAAFLAKNVKRKNTLIIYGAGKKDSVMAANFHQAAIENGLNVVRSLRIQPRDVGSIIDILARPTEFDEFDYPVQFTLKKDSIGSIYVASDDALIYAKVVSSVDVRKDSIRIVGSENWLDESAIEPEKYQTLGIVLAAPNFVQFTRPAFKSFFKRFTRTYGRTPSKVARMGYELMIIFGNQLKANGVFFQDGLIKSGAIPGHLTEGFDYQFTRDNGQVPFISFDDGELILLEKH